MGCGVGNGRGLENMQAFSKHKQHCTEPRKHGKLSKETGEGNGVLTTGARILGADVRYNKAGSPYNFAHRSAVQDLRNIQKAFPASSSEDSQQKALAQ